MLQKRLQEMIKVGRLTVQLPDGRAFTAGKWDPGRTPDVAIRLRGRSTALKLALHPEFYLGEAYMDGELVIERGRLWDLLELIGRNRPAKGQRHRASEFYDWAMGQLQQSNSPRRAKRNVAHHYDLSQALYRNFLDEDLQYSCAYFPEPGLSLEEAQRAKVRHIAAKLRLSPGQRVLDIGCGWGGLALAVARMSDVQVTGITLSREQLQVCLERAHRMGLDGRVRFELCDYRQVEGAFDRIVSVGMFEHVGAPRYADYFEAVQRLMTDDGVALIHSIGHKGQAGRNNPWFEKYIFPGGHIPALSEMAGAVEGTDLWITDVEVLRLHYAETLRRWRERFLRNAAAMRELYDERFVRMWEFYLASSEMGFRYGDLMVLQTQLAKRVDALPVTRDYMVAAERLGAGADRLAEPMMTRTGAAL